MKRFGARLEQLHDRRVEADRDGVRDLDDQDRPGCRSAPRLAGSIAVPRPVHPEMSPDLEPVRAADEQVLADRLHRFDRRADEPADLGAVPRAGRGDDARDEMWPQPRRGPGQRVAFGHQRDADDVERRTRPR